MLNSHLDAKLVDMIDSISVYIATIKRIVANPAYYERWEASLKLAKLDAMTKCVFSVSLGAMHPRMTVGRAPIKLGFIRTSSDICTGLLHNMNIWSHVGLNTCQNRIRDGPALVHASVCEKLHMHIYHNGIVYGDRT